MSDTHEHIVCPNCGFHASENYCARCGQETHLHNDTFWALIMHFIGHYFHYDSKFWQTIKALWFSPGKLTLAYWNKQRMRFIAPISLYIFISVVFFLICSVFSEPVHLKLNTKDHSRHGLTISNYDDAAVDTTTMLQFHSSHKVKSGNAANIPKMSAEETEDMMEKARHYLPKVFFFMIPLMGLVLLLLFYKRKDLNYVNHIIFALHYHTFWFSLVLFMVLYPFNAGEDIIDTILLLLTVLYFIIALKKVYNLTWPRAISYSLIVGVAYVVFFVVAFIAMMACIVGPRLLF